MPCLLDPSSNLPDTEAESKQKSIALNSFSILLKMSRWKKLGARLRGRTATQPSKKGSEKVLGRVLRKGSQKGS